MNLTKSLFQNSIVYFVLFFLFALWGFWPTYYSNPVRPSATIIHIHGLFMTLWCLLLIAQGALIRNKNTKLHKTLGKVSYVLVPAIIISGISVAHHAVRTGPDLPADVYYSSVGHLYVIWMAFALIYGLAIWNRKDSATHARYMVGTMFPAFSPIFSRLVGNVAPGLIPLFPTMSGVPVVPLFAFGLADIILIVLTVLDLQKRKKWQGFPIVLIIVLCHQASDFILYRFQFWRSFLDWITGLPLS